MSEWAERPESRPTQQVGPTLLHLPLPRADVLVADCRQADHTAWLPRRSRGRSAGGVKWTLAPASSSSPNSTHSRSRSAAAPVPQ